MAFLVMLLIAAKAPGGFPINNAIFLGLIAVLGFVMPYVLGLLKYSTWKSRFWKTVISHIIAAAVAFLSALLVRVTTGDWPFEFRLEIIFTTGWAWTQFCYNAFVKTWLSKQSLTR